MGGGCVAQADAQPRFDERGRLRLEPGTTRWGFESEAPPAAWDVVGFGGPGTAVPKPLEGERALRMSPEGLRTLFIYLRRVAGADRSVDVRLWQRSEGIRMSATVVWAVGDIDAALAAGRIDELFVLSQIALRPTEHRTSDGWQQWSTGSVDFALGRRISPILVPQDHGQSLPPLVRTQGGVSVDAVEVSEVGDARVRAAACSLPTEREACGPEGRCWLGRCVDARAVEGPDFDSARHRTQYFERRQEELRMWAGHRRAQRNLGEAERILSELQREAPTDMWTRMGLAYEVLEDGHARPARHLAAS